MSNALRDRGYLASAALLAVIASLALFLVLHRGGDAAVDSVATPATEPTATATPPSYASVLLDTKRQLDLARLGDALEAYRQRTGAYPSSYGNFTTFCVAPLDAGCLVVATRRDLPTTDGLSPYWYQSDGVTYALFSRAESVSPDEQCPGDVPPALESGPVFCLTSGGAE